MLSFALIRIVNEENIARVLGRVPRGTLPGKEEKEFDRIMIN